jgi:hypothetical protein
VGGGVRFQWGEAFSGARRRKRVHPTARVLLRREHAFRSVAWPSQSGAAHEPDCQRWNRDRRAFLQPVRRGTVAGTEHRFGSDAAAARLAGSRGGGVGAALTTLPRQAFTQSTDQPTATRPRSLDLLYFGLPQQPLRPHAQHQHDDQKRDRR